MITAQQKYAWQRLKDVLIDQLMHHASSTLHLINMDVQVYRDKYPLVKILFNLNIPQPKLQPNVVQHTWKLKYFIANEDLFYRLT